MAERNPVGPEMTLAEAEKILAEAGGILSEAEKTLVESGEAAAGVEETLIEPGQTHFTPLPLG